MLGSSLYHIRVYTGVDVCVRFSVCLYIYNIYMPVHTGLKTHSHRGMCACVVRALCACDVHYYIYIYIYTATSMYYIHYIHGVDTCVHIHIYTQCIIS